MKRETEQIIQQTLENVVGYIDQLPNGEFISSEWQPPKGFKNERFKVNDIPVEHLVPKEKGTNNIIFQIHGGGYIVALCDLYRDTAVKYSEMVGGAEVFSLDYRVAPTNSYPAALEDAVTVYKWILEQGYDSNNIIITGDSAGGNLALATTVYLKDHNIPLPKAIIAISPWSNAANDFPSVKTNIEKDVILGRYGLKMSNQIDNPIYFQGANYKEPYLEESKAAWQEMREFLEEIF